MPDPQPAWDNLPTKREQFTMAALQGILAGRKKPVQKIDHDDLAKLATDIADAALRHLEKTRL